MQSCSLRDGACTPGVLLGAWSAFEPCRSASRVLIIECHAAGHACSTVHFRLITSFGGTRSALCLSLRREPSGASSQTEFPTPNCLAPAQAERRAGGSEQCDGRRFHMAVHDFRADSYHDLRLGGRPGNQGGGPGQPDGGRAAGGVPGARHPRQRVRRGRAGLHDPPACRVARAVAQPVRDWHH